MSVHRRHLAILSSGSAEPLGSLPGEAVSKGEVGSPRRRKKTSAKESRKNMDSLSQSPSFKSTETSAHMQANDGSEAKESLKVGELARVTGKTVRALHLYEKMGLLEPVDRSAGRYRLYDQSSVERVRWISKMQSIGFSLPDLQDIVEQHHLASSAKEAAASLSLVYNEKLKAVREKLAELRRLERELHSSLVYLGACESACAEGTHADACLSCRSHGDQPVAPALVAGAYHHRSASTPRLHNSPIQSQPIQAQKRSVPSSLDASPLE